MQIYVLYVWKYNIYNATVCKESKEKWRITAATELSKANSMYLSVYKV